MAATEAAEAVATEAATAAASDKAAAGPVCHLGDRDVTLRPLAEVIGDYSVVRAGAYTAYRRRLGPDAAKLPEGFEKVVDDVIIFADPALASEVASRAIWTARNGSRNG